MKNQSVQLQNVLKAQLEEVSQDRELKRQSIFEVWTILSSTAWNSLEQTSEICTVGYAIKSSSARRVFDASDDSWTENDMFHNFYELRLLQKENS